MQHFWPTILTAVPIAQDCVCLSERLYVCTVAIRFWGRRRYRWRRRWLVPIGCQ